MLSRALILGLLLPAAAGVAAAESRVEPRSLTYRLDQWTPADGLPSWQVRDLLEGPDGYLWIATPAGLVRFDGHQVHVIDRRSAPTLPTNRVQSVYATRDGEIWFGGTDYLVRLLDSGGVEPVATVEGLVHAVAEDSTGRVWLYVDDGRVCFLEGGDVRAGPEGAAEGFHVERTGVFWLRDRDGALLRVEGDRREPSGVRQVVPDSPLWVLHRQFLGEADRGPPLATEVVGDRIEARDMDGRLVASWPAAADAVPWIVDRRGTLWVGRRGAVEGYRGEGPEPLYRQELGEGALVSEILEDHEGNLWIGTRARGVFRMRPNFIEAYHAPGAQLFRRFTADADGSLLVASSAGLYRVGRGELRPYLTADGRRASARHVDLRGAVWHVVDGRLVGRATDGRQVDLEVGAVSLFANTPADPDGFWVGSPDGLFRVEPDAAAGARVERRFPDEVAGPDLLHVDRDGRLWIATPDGLLRLDGDRLERLDAEVGIDGVEVRAFLEDPDGTLWLGTINHGLVRLGDGPARRIDSAVGLSEDGVFALLADGEGRFWMSGNRGIHRAARDEIEALLDGGIEGIRSAHFGSESGPINPEEGGDLGAVDADGILWFSTHDGVIRIDPGRADELTGAPPRVHIEELRVEGERLPIDPAGGVVLGPELRRFDVEFTGISLRDAEAVRFEARLDPLDSRWLPIGGDRHVRYANLDPGRYTFRVRAISGGGVPSRDEASLPIAIEPAVWETGWFRAATVATIALLGVVAFRLRLREHRRREVELDDKVRLRTEELAHERDRAGEALREVERTNRVIEAQAQRLEELDAAKSRFFANVSHEFRTPLTLILGPLDDVADGMHGEMSDAARQQIALAGDNARRLLRLVNQLLDTARLESGRLRLQTREEDLARLVRRIADPFRPLAERSGIEFVVETARELPRVWLDAEQFEKVLTNLLSNAFKFTDAGGRVELRTVADAGRVRISVHDDGPGIPEDERERVFDRFYQASGGTSSMQAGTGIGLALARDLVELHHGTISVRGGPTGGATFEVVLPLGDGHLSADEKAPPDTGPLAKRLREARLEEQARRAVLDDGASGARLDRATDAESDDEDRTTLLIVDDNEGLRGYLRGRLEGAYRVVEAADGVQALDAIAARVPDLIVSDLMMPEMDGLELCRRIKEDRELDFVPVILLTAKASIESRVAGLETGADDYLAKPFEARELLARIDNLIASRRRLKRRLAEGAVAAAGPSPRADGPEADLLDAVGRVIDERYADEDFGIDDLARALGQSRRTLYRRLEAVGASPAELIQNRRLDHAATLLARREGNVTDVAYAVGFRSVSHFSRRFRERHGMSPSEARSSGES